MPTADTTGAVRKRPVRKAKTVETPVTTTVVRKTPARRKMTGKEVPAQVVKNARRKPGDPKPVRERRKASPGSLNFANGSDMALAFEELQRGGATRTEVNRRIMERFADARTKRGNPKPVTTIVNQVLKRAAENGWTVQAMWHLVPPPTVPGDVMLVTDGIQKPELTPMFVAPVQPSETLNVKPEVKKSPPRRVRAPISAGAANYPKRATKKAITT